MGEHGDRVRKTHAQNRKNKKGTELMLFERESQVTDAVVNLITVQHAVLAVRGREGSGDEGRDQHPTDKEDKVVTEVD